MRFSRLAPQRCEKRFQAGCGVSRLRCGRARAAHRGSPCRVRTARPRPVRPTVGRCVVRRVRPIWLERCPVDHQAACAAAALARERGTRCRPRDSRSCASGSQEHRWPAVPHAHRGSPGPPGRTVSWSGSNSLARKGRDVLVTRRWRKHQTWYGGLDERQNRRGFAAHLAR